MAPSLATIFPYKVALVGEALGEDEAKAGAPFVGKAGFKLTRLIEWAGLDRSRFDIWNTVWCRPPANKLEGESYEETAIKHCRDAYWASLVSRVRVIVPLGNVALGTFSGRKRILSVRGYIQEGPDGTHVVPTVHPSFIQRGQSKYSAAFIHDLQKAVELAAGGFKAEFTSYSLDPLPFQAYEWAKQAVASGRRIAYDIETPGKGEDEGDLGEDDDPTYFIYRIGFADDAHHALSVPWAAAYMAAIRLLMESPNEKVVWNAGFDNPRITAAGVGINGTVHDGMVAWHILHSDLPKGLGFVATFTCPYQPAWKHLSHQRPAFYNATDADVEWRSFDFIERELKRTGLWDVYQSDVVDLDPILSYMSGQGMPIDASVRLERACQLSEKQREVMTRMERAVPIECRSWRPKEGYVKAPKDTEGMVEIEVGAEVKRCSICGALNPTSTHFRTFKKPTAEKPQNGCAGGSVSISAERVKRVAKLVAFKPSRQQLIKYQIHFNRNIPRTRDKKTREMKPTMDEKAIKSLIGRYPDDVLYPSVLEYRELDKLAGTYIGRPVDVAKDTP